MKNTLRMTVTINGKSRVMLDTLKEYYGLEYDSEAIRWIIMRQYEKVISPMRYGKSNKLDPNYDSSQGEIICNSLGGEVKDGSCHFIKYDMINPKTVMKFEQAKPLTALTIKDIDTQFMGGNKEDIFAVVEKQKQDALKELELNALRETDLYNIEPTIAPDNVDV